MKTILSLALSCLLLFASIGHAQQISVGISAQLTFAEYDDIEIHFEDFETNESDFDEMECAMMEAAMKQMFRTMWNDQGIGLMSLMLLGDAELHEIPGVSEEQVQQFGDALEMMGERMAEEVQERAGAFLQSLGIDPENPDVEALHALDPEMMMEFGLGIHEQMIELSINAMSEALESILLPEQIQSIREMQLAAMGEMPFISPSAFEALGLTDDQREELERIKKELEPEFEENLDFFVKNWLMLEETLDSEHFSTAENPEYRRLMDEIQARSREFSEKVRMRMFDVLTDEQWMRLEELLDNPPEHARIFIHMIRESMGFDAIGFGEHGELENASESDEAGGMWMPGPDSWRPGMPIPESYRQQRNERRFPSRQ